MKKTIALAIALVLALGLAACGGSGGTAVPTSGEDTTTAAQGGDTAETQPSPTPAPDGNTVPLSAAPSETLSGEVASTPSATETTTSPSSPTTVSSTPESLTNNSYTIDHPLFVQAQVLNTSNGDDYTPFNLQWIDGANGVISFEVQRLDITSPPDYHEYEIIVFHNGRDVIETGVGGFVGGRTQNPTTTVTVNLGDDVPFTDYGAGEYFFIVYAALKDEVIGQVVKSDVFVSDGSSQTPNTTLNIPDDSTNSDALQPASTPAISSAPPAPATYSLTIVNQTGKDIGSITVTVLDNKGQAGLGSTYYEDAMNGRERSAIESVLDAGESKIYTIPGADGGYNGMVDIKARTVDGEGFNYNLVEGLLSGDTFIIGVSAAPDISTVDTSSAPLGGTIPMPDGFPSNPGDAEFFNFQTDDYALAKVVNVSANAEQQVDSGVMMFCFDADGNTVAVYEKWIMASESDAVALSQIIADRSNWVNSDREVEEFNQVGNVIFMSWGSSVIDYYGFGTKGGVLGYTSVHSSVSLSDFYFSKP